jgi:hypothetical protein
MQSSPPLSDPPARPSTSPAGGEDGYVRLHHFDLDYLSGKFF